MMKAVILVACLGALVLAEDPPQPSGGYQPPQPSYGGYGGGYGNPSQAIIYELQNLIANVTGLNANDEKIDVKIQQLLQDNRVNSALRETFLKEIYPNILKEQAAQDALLTDLEKKAKALLRLSDDVNEIDATIDALQYELGEINKTRAEYLERIAALRNADAKQDEDLAAINAQLDEQEAELEKLEDRSHEVAARIVKLEKTLHQVFEAINSESAQSVEAVLTPDRDEEVIYLVADFNGRSADIQYGITSMHVSDHQNSYQYQPAGYGYGGYGQQAPNLPNINFSVDVQYDQEANKVTARLFDFSKAGWVVSKVVVGITVFRLDDRIISTYEN